jgi:geranylgeranyl reductase family protein
MTPVFDVAVVGAGPAGSSAAYHLASRGHRVLLLEKAAFPRDKACGDGLTAQSLQLLAQMGLSDKLASALKIAGLRVITERGERVLRCGPGDADRPGYAAVLPRIQLDHLVCQAAVDQGATLWERSRVAGFLTRDERVAGVRVLCSDREVEVSARYVVLADGGSSPLARQLGLGGVDRATSGYAVSGYFTGLTGIEPLFEIHAPATDPETGRPIAGYGWVFPTGAGSANIGVGYFQSQQGDQRLNLRQIADHFVADLRARDSRFSQMRQTSSLRGGPLRCGLDPDRCTRPGVVLVGDAAGLVDPLTGEGIDTALTSGALAAQLLGRLLEQSENVDSQLAEYGQLLDERYHDRFQRGRDFIGIYMFLSAILEGSVDIAGVPGELLEYASGAVGGGGGGRRPATADLTDIQAIIRKAMAAVWAEVAKRM